MFTFFVLHHFLTFLGSVPLGLVLRQILLRIDFLLQKRCHRASPLASQRAMAYQGQIQEPRILLPKGPAFAPTTVPVTAQQDSTSHFHIEAHETAENPLTPKRKRKAPTIPEAEWGRVKKRIRQLYIDEGMGLTAVMEKLEEETGFAAT